MCVSVVCRLMVARRKRPSISQIGIGSGVPEFPGSDVGEFRGSVELEPRNPGTVGTPEPVTYPYRFRVSAQALPLRPARSPTARSPPALVWSASGRYTRARSRRRSARREIVRRLPSAGRGSNRCSNRRTPGRSIRQRRSFRPRETAPHRRPDRTRGVRVARRLTRSIASARVPATTIAPFALEGRPRPVPGLACGARRPRRLAPPAIGAWSRKWRAPPDRAPLARSGRPQSSRPVPRSAHTTISLGPA